MRRAIAAYTVACLASFALLYASEQAQNDVLQIVLYAFAYLFPSVAVLSVCREKGNTAILTHPFCLDRSAWIWTLRLSPCMLSVLLAVSFLYTWLFSADASAHAVTVVPSFTAILRYVLLCPLVEECFFRLVPMRIFEKDGIRVAFLMNMLGFAAHHASSARLLHALLAAALFFTVDLLTQSLWPSLLVHSVNNLLVLLWTAFPMHSIPGLVLLLALGGATLISLISLFLHRDDLKQRIKSKCNMT